MLKFKDARAFTVFSIFSGGVLNRASAVILDIYLAVLFGAGSYISTFILAFRVFQVMKRIMTENGIQMMVVVPYLQEMKKKSKSSTVAFLIRFIIASLVYQIAIISLVELGIFLTLFKYNLISTSYQDFVKCLGIVLIGGPIIYLYMMFSAVLQSENRFFITSFAPAIFNISWVVGIYISSKRFGLDLVILSSMLILALIAQCFVVSIPAINTLQKWSRIHSRKLKDISLKVNYSIIMGIIGIGVIQINSLIDTIFCSIAEDSGPAYMWYATRVIVPVAGIIGNVLAGSFIPELSKKYGSGSVVESDRLVEKLFMKSFFITLPLTGLFISGLTSWFSITLLHGNFTDSDLEATVRCALAIALSVPFIIAIRVIYSKYYAQRRPHVTAVISFMAISLNAILDYICVVVLGKTTTYVALATTVSLAVQTLFVYYKFSVDALHKSTSSKHGSKIFSLFLVTLFSTTATITVSGSILGDGTLPIIYGQSFPGHAEALNSRVLGILAVCSLYISIFLMLAYLSNIFQIMKSILSSLTFSKVKKSTSYDASILEKDSTITHD